MEPSCPATAPISTEVLFDPGLKAGVFQFYARLLGLAWNGQALGPLDIRFADLHACLRVSTSTAFKHLRALKAAGYVVWVSDRRGGYHIEFLTPETDT